MAFVRSEERTDTWEPVAGWFAMAIIANLLPDPCREPAVALPRGEHYTGRRLRRRMREVET
jgi:hypothetical protein